MRRGAAPRDSSNNGRILSIGANAKYCGNVLFCDVNVKYDSTRPPFPGFTGTPHFKRGSVVTMSSCFNSEKASLSSRAAPTKLVPLSEIIDFGCPRLAMNL